MFFETCANTLVREQLPPLDLLQACFHFLYEPGVEIDKLHNRGTRQGVRIRASLVGEARAFGFHAGWSYGSHSSQSATKTLNSNRVLVCSELENTIFFPSGENSGNDVKPAKFVICFKPVPSVLMM